MCSKCNAPAEIFCVDCALNYCSSCSCRAHHPGTNTELHSLEKITKEEKQSIKIITPLTEEILCATLIYILSRHTFIKEDYLYNATICPIGGYVQYTVASFDAGIFYLAKETLSWECGMEDAYWRLFTDAWVRDIVTSSDGLALMLPSLLRAWCFNQALTVTIVPFLAMVYSAIFMAAGILESLLPRIQPFISIEKFVQGVDILPFEGQLPPETQPRKRPSQDFVECVRYWRGRYLRKWNAFYEASTTALLATITAPVKYVVGFRLACMLVPATGELIRAALGYCGLASVLERHTNWFDKSPGMEHIFSDHVLEKVLSACYAFLNSGLINQVLSPVLSLMQVVAGETYVEVLFLLIPYFVYRVVKYGIEKVRNHQQAWFKGHWDRELRQQVLGGCSAEDHTACQCQCIIEKCVMKRNNCNHLSS